MVLSHKSFWPMCGGCCLRAAAGAGLGNWPSQTCHRATPSFRCKSVIGCPHTGSPTFCTAAAASLWLRSRLQSPTSSLTIGKFGPRFFHSSTSYLPSLRRASSTIGRRCNFLGFGSPPAGMCMFPTSTPRVPRCTLRSASRSAASTSSAQETSKACQTMAVRCQRLSQSESECTSCVHWFLTFHMLKYAPEVSQEAFGAASLTSMSRYAPECPAARKPSFMPPTSEQKTKSWRTWRWVR